jgi:hypothetical protein
VSGAVFVDSAKANGFVPEYKYLPEIVINSDGTVTPETNLIKQIGLTYTLTADVNGYAVRIERSNIVFDGAGHIINTTDGDNVGLRLAGVNSVIVKNLEILSRYDKYIDYYSRCTSIYLYCSNCLLTNIKTNYRMYLAGSSNSNTITNSTVHILHLYKNANNNLFIKNNVLRELSVDGSNNTFSQNNFFLTGLPLIHSSNFWDNGSVGNYWGNYSMKYTNASEIGNGISDKPYIIERDWYSTKEYPDSKNVDNYPLMYPYDIENNTIAFPKPEPQPEPELFPTAPVAATSAVTVALVGMGLLVYFKKRKR